MIAMIVIMMTVMTSDKTETVLIKTLIEMLIDEIRSLYEVFILCQCTLFLQETTERKGDN